MSDPTKEQIKRFIDCFEALSKFEAMIQLTRGMSAFRDNEWPDKPDPSVIAVKDWLTDLANQKAH